MSVKRSRSSEGRCSITETKFVFYFLAFGLCANFKTTSFLCGHPLKMLFYGQLKPRFLLFLNDTEHLNVNNIVRWCLILVVVDLLRQVSTLTGPLSTADFPLHKCAPVKIRSPTIWARHVQMMSLTSQCFSAFLEKRGLNPLCLQTAHP